MGAYYFPGVLHCSERSAGDVPLVPFTGAKTPPNQLLSDFSLISIHPQLQILTDKHNHDYTPEVPSETNV